MRIFLFLSIYSFSVFAYVPTVESLFRHGGNADVSSNSIVVNFKITKEVTESEANAEHAYFKIVMTKAGDTLKISQAQFLDDSYSDSSMIHKAYNSNFSPFSIGEESAQVEKGLFWGLMKSIFFNDGKHIVNYLKTLGTDIKLNEEIINKSKINYLVEYKKYLILSSKGSKRKDLNPLKPEDLQEKSKVEKTMSESMYADFDQVHLLKKGEELYWGVNANNFQAVFSYENRHPVKVKYRQGNLESDIECLNYFNFDGSHFSPKEIIVKTFDGEKFKIDLLNIKYFSEREEDLIRRLQRWDSLVKLKKDSVARPQFLL
jgi:hypothetical protein